MAWTGVITNNGATMLENWASGSQTLTIDRATAGAGTYNGTAALRAATAVSDERQEGSVVSAAPTTGGTQYVVQIGAREEGAYEMRQVGIWAHLGDDASSLLALYQSDAAIDIPAVADDADFVYTLNAIVLMSNTGSMSVTVDRGAYITLSTLETALADYVKTVDGVGPDANGNVNIGSGNYTEIAVGDGSGIYSTISGFTTSTFKTVTRAGLTTLYALIRTTQNLSANTEYIPVYITSDAIDTIGIPPEPAYTIGRCGDILVEGKLSLSSTGGWFAIKPTAAITTGSSIVFTTFTFLKT